MSVRFSTAAALLLAIGCAPVPAPEPGPGAMCDAAPVQYLIGRSRSDALGAEALRRSGARSLRWIRPGDMVTMDFRTDRLNIDLDEQGRVTGLRCG